jgi:hypothetical protein
VRVALAGALLGLAFALGCAGDSLVVADGRLRSERDQFSVHTPERPPWKPISVDRALAAFRAPGPAFMSVQSRCGRPLASPQIMARHLEIGLPERMLRQSGPVGVGPWQGWSQIFDTLEEGAAVRLKTVTIVAGDCTFDWILSARAGFEDVEPSFDAWWRSFEYHGPTAAEGREEAGR